MMYYAARLMSWLCCRLPWAACEALGRAMGRFAWLVVPKWRKEMAAENVRLCLGVDEAEAVRIARESTVRLGTMCMEVLRFPLMRGRMADYVEIEGLEKLKEGLALGRGAVIAASHSGNWELMGGALAQAGIPLVGVAKKQKSSGADRFIIEYRTLIGMHITYRTGVREMFDMMAEGWAIGLIMDQDPSRREGIVIDFFGRPTNSVVGPASMARFRDVPIFTAFMHRQPNGRHRLVVGTVEAERTKDKKADIRRTTQRINERIEAHVRRYPEDWFWLHDRWKSMREAAE